jgi:hypothetical protein
MVPCQALIDNSVAGRSRNASLVLPTWLSLSWLYVNLITPGKSWKSWLSTKPTLIPFQWRWEEYLSTVRKGWKFRLPMWFLLIPWCRGLCYCCIKRSSGNVLGFLWYYPGLLLFFLIMHVNQYHIAIQTCLLLLTIDTTILSK